MHESASNGVVGDATRDGVGAPSRDDVDPTIARSFFGRERMIPAAYGSLMTPITVYWGGDETFNVTFGQTACAAFDVWTDERGMEAMIMALQAALVRARIARGTA